MKSLSRRGFFQSLKSLTGIVSEFGKSKDGVINSEAKENIFCVGSVSEFPLGLEREFLCRDGFLTIRSTEYGLSAEFLQQRESKFVALFLEKNGKLSVNLDQFCPRGSLFSLLTGEMTGEMMGEKMKNDYQGERA
ncbi:MAG: hypothetical protein IPJ71_12090 [Bdellovibrionales bacterium]|nr:hypothetical protein [Bdellovibrionales bacterium]